ncbi:S-layer homology domain-containing protein [Cohnella mopanensis]|uniref:S-layer homology domain-containing protein n=1 Tax=Cohnella mopanensis TaxID=2911966 RepID=UPI001EF790CE|nr:S-layer homology domain-containing protein [Cohnella mopanensis]
MRIQAGKRLVSFILSVLIVLSTMSTAVFATAKDLTGHWAKGTIDQMLDAGTVQGYSDGTFRPNAPITRSEWVSLINKTFKIDEPSDNHFSDLNEKAWYYKDIVSAVGAGYATGFKDGTFKPLQPVSRQEAAVMLSKLLVLNDSLSATQFSDAKGIAKWSSGAIGAVVDQQIMVGSKGLFRPTDVLTRAEAVVLLNRLAKKNQIVFKQAGTYGTASQKAVLRKNLLIDAPGITLQNVEVNGDLVLGKGIGEGDVFLKNVKVTGKTIVQGGGEHSVHFENTIMLTVVVDKADGTVRIVVEGAAQIAEFQIQSPVRVEADKNTKVDSVTLSEKLPEGSQINLVGQFETVNVLAKHISIEIPSGSIGELNVGKDAADSSIKLNKEAQILSLIMNAATSILGEGSITAALVNAAGVTMEQKPTEIKLGTDVPKDTTVKVGGSSQPVTTPAAGGSSGSSGSPETTTRPEDRTPPTLNISATEITSGDKISAKSNENGYIYMMPSSVPGLLIDLNLAARDGVGKKVSVVANQTVEISTTNFLGGLYYVVAADVAGNVSALHHVYVMDSENSPLNFTGLSTGGSNTQAWFTFNRGILNNLNNLDQLKAALRFSSDGGTTFRPLGANDTIRLFNTALEVTFATPFTGKDNVLQLAANSLKDSNGVVLDRIMTSWTFAAGALFIAKPQASVHLNDTLKFKVDMAVTVYLSPTILGGGSGADFEHRVVLKQAKKLIVTEAMVGQELELSTAELPAGIYTLYLWGGDSVKVDIDVTPILQPHQITVANVIGDQDSVTVTGLAEGSIVKVYRQWEDTAPIAASIPVPAGQTAVIVNVGQLGMAAGYLLVTVTAPPYGESEKAYVTYLDESNAPNAPLSIKNAYLDSNNSAIHINLNRTATSDVVDLKSNVLMSTDGGVVFLPLAAGDTVSINGDHITVTLATQFQSPLLKVKIVANTLKDSDDNIRSEDLTTGSITVNPFFVVKPQASVTAGTQISFSVNTPGTVYLVPTGTNGDQSQFDQAALQKLTVGAAQVGQTVTMDTANIAPGVYAVLIWSGEYLQIAIN